MFLKERGIKHISTGVRRPTTIGKVERFHRTLNREVIKKFHFNDGEDVQEAFENYRYYYNYQRPHQALDNLPPISRYKFVQREYPQAPVPIFYPEGSNSCPTSCRRVRKVRGNGCIVFNHTEIYLSRILIDKPARHLAGGLVKIEQKKNLLEIYYDKKLIKTVT